MNLIRFALRRPVTIIIAMFAGGLISLLALSRMPVDIFPSLNLPVIYVAQPYGGMDPLQMEGMLTNYYEYHFLYISGIHHVESKNIQGVALMKLVFHPGTDMAQAMAETISYVNRSRSFMPPGTVPPFVMRFDVGSVPVGYLVFSSENQDRTIGEIQDQALFKVRPLFASLPGVSAPPPFGGNQRTIVVRAKADRLRAYAISPDEVVAAITTGNTISPSGNIQLGNLVPMVPSNSIVNGPQEMLTIPVRTGPNPVYLRDLAEVADSTDIATGYALVNGRRSVYILVTKRADASTLAVVREVKAALPAMQGVLPPDIQVRLEFDQSPIVTRAIRGLALEGGLGAILTGLMVLLFLRDWRSGIIVVLNIPFALLAAVVALWLCGQSINLMTLGGLALAVGILVDEATVAIENIHTHLRERGGKTLARAVLDGASETAIPRLLAMLSVLAVFVPSFLMQGAPRALFVPLSLAVGFSMLASYLLSSTFVPVLSSWLLGPRVDQPARSAPSALERFRERYRRSLSRLTLRPAVLLLVYLGLSLLVVVLVGGRVGLEIFPAVDEGQFQLRLRAPDGTSIDRTEAIALSTLDLIKKEVGSDQVDVTVGLVGTASYNYPINSIYLWTSGPQEAVLRVALKKGSGVRVEELKERLRSRLAESQPEVRLSFLAGELVSEVMSFGSPAPVEIAVTGPRLEESREYAEKIRTALLGVTSLRDLQYAQTLEYPTVEVKVDRERAGLSGVTVADVSRSLVEATASSRFVVPNFWRDPKTGIGYQVQVEVPASEMRSLGAVETIPIKRAGGGQLLLRDVGQVTHGGMPGEIDRYNMRRTVSLTANLFGEDLGRVARRIDRALAELGQPPRGVVVEVRGQIAPLREMQSGLLWGLVAAVAAILLLLAANFQSLALSLAVVSTVPAVLAGVALALLVTATRWNVQSFIGAIMAVGVAVANSILLVTFAERRRREGAEAREAALWGAQSRLRPILMTSCAMIAGMIPMALALGQGSEQSAPLGRAVIGGLTGGTLATLTVLPAVFALIQSRRSRRSPSLDPGDPESLHFSPLPPPSPSGGAGREGEPR
jgi:multidrug efflux pump subunit AcrB